MLHIVFISGNESIHGGIDIEVIGKCTCIHGSSCTLLLLLQEVLRAEFEGLPVGLQGHCLRVDSVESVEFEGEVEL
jgi:hypothetical protein